MLDHHATIGAFLSAAAAKQPTPGGGSVTALVGALSAAMGEMVLNYSVGKKDLAAHEEELKAALAELTRARRLLTDLMAEDQAAFTALTAARKLAAGSPGRDASFAAALLACVRVPQAMAATAVAILELCDRVVPMVNKYLLSDLAVAGDLAMATLRCAAYNVRINLADISGDDERTEIEQLNTQLLARAVPLIRRLSSTIWQRVAANA